MDAASVEKIDEATMVVSHNTVEDRRLPAPAAAAAAARYSEDAGEELLGIDIIKAAIRGDESIFDDPNLSNEHFFRKTSDQNNILHIASRYKQTNFITTLLEKDLGSNKKLLTGTNSQGNTPLHVAAQVQNQVRIAKMLYDYMKMSVEGSGDDEEEKPWTAQNSEGNTALHLAILSHNDNVAGFLTMSCDGLATIVNNSREAPLHLAISRLSDLSRTSKIIRTLLQTASNVGSWRDAKGLTPLLRAASLNSFVIVHITKMIIDVCPESTLVCDASGKSFLHLLAGNKVLNVYHNVILDKLYIYNQLEKLISLEEIRILIDLQDKDGNTPIHIAAKCQNMLMVQRLYYECQNNFFITNNDGISNITMVEQLNFHQIDVPRIMRSEEYSSAKQGHIKFLQEKQCDVGKHFYGSQDSEGGNFLHFLMDKLTEQHLSSYEECLKFYDFVESALENYPKLVCKKDIIDNTPLHILAQYKDFCNTLAKQTYCESRSLLSKLISTCVDAITKYESERTTTINEADDNHGHGLPWVVQNVDGNTPLHEAIIANNKVMVLELLNYSDFSAGSARLVNKNKETPLHLLITATSIGMEEFTVEEIMEMVKATSKALVMQDKSGVVPMLRAIKVNNLNAVVSLLLYTTVQEFSDTSGQTLWKCFLQNQSKKLLDELIQLKTFKNMLKQKDKDGNTLLHIAIEEKCFVFVLNLLETCGSERESSEWLMDLLRITNNVGEAPEDLLADLPTLSPQLEEKLLTDRRMRGIRSSWKIPRTQLQNYMSSMNVIAALQTTITFTAAFTVPGGLNQDIGTPILIQRISFQAFMISDVIAMCLSMMVLICLLWMVATNKRDSVMIQDFALTLLLLSFVATLLTFMTGIYATIYPAEPWIAITTLVLCSLLMLFLHRYMLTTLLLLFKYPKGQFVQKMCSRPTDNSNTQEQSSDSAV